MPEAYLLIVDIWGTQAEALTLPNQCFLILEEMRELARMTELAPSTIVYAEGEGKAWGPGVSGLGLLTDSHQSLHGLEEWGIAHLDLFSCKAFDWERIARMLEERFGGHGQVKVLSRKIREGHKIVWSTQW